MTIELDPNIDVFEKHIRISDEGFCTTSTLKLLHCFGMDRKRRESLLRCYTIFIFATLGILIGYNFATSNQIRETTIYDTGAVGQSGESLHVMEMAARDVGEDDPDDVMLEGGDVQDVDAETLAADGQMVEQDIGMENTFNEMSDDLGQENQQNDMLLYTRKATPPPLCFDRVEVHGYNRTLSGKILRDTAELEHNKHHIQPPGEACESREPTVVIIGVPKAGGRVLMDFMQLNPYVETYFTPTSYEMPYFNKYYNSKGRHWLETQMPCSYSNQHTVIKMSSYFHDKLVPERIRKYNRNMKIILLVREPIERLISAFTFGPVCRDINLLARFDEQADSIDMDLTMLRRFMEMSVYDESIRIWMKFFNSSQMLIIDASELKQDPLSVLNRVEDFLGIEHTITEDMFVFNAHKGFYCLKSTLTSTGMVCYDENRGKKHEELPEDIRTRLKNLYAPRNKNFFNLIGKTFDW